MITEIMTLRQNIEIKGISSFNTRPNIAWAGDKRLASSEPIFFALNRRDIDSDVE